MENPVLLLKGQKHSSSVRNACPSKPCCALRSVPRSMRRAEFCRRPRPSPISCNSSKSIDITAVIYMFVRDHLLGGICNGKRRDGPDRRRTAAFRSSFERNPTDTSKYLKAAVSSSEDHRLRKAQNGPRCCRSIMPERKATVRTKRTGSRSYSEHRNVRVGYSYRAKRPGRFLRDAGVRERTLTRAILCRCGPTVEAGPIQQRPCTRTFGREKTPERRMHLNK